MTRTRLIQEDISLEQDVPVPMPDGVQLSTNIFRRNDAKCRPAIVSVTPYGKDKLPDRLGMLFMRLGGVRFGRLDCSRWTGFESPDPLFWCKHDYAVVQADIRGMHKSEGHAGVLTAEDATDFAELIEWVGRQPWCTGDVGLCGVSYLAMSQWRVAALRPPSLKAMIPWEGVTDLLREFAFQDGVPDTGFLPVWWKNRYERGRNKKFSLAEQFVTERDRHSLDDAWWESKRASLEEVRVPALVCANWSDAGLHTRGSLLGFERIGSPEKWLYTHGRRKWETFYSEQARLLQLHFFDRFLKGIRNDWEKTPPVRLEVRKTRELYAVRSEKGWPLKNVEHRALYLKAQDGALVESPLPEQSSRFYSAQPRGTPDRARFTYTFRSDTELTGSMSLKLWVSTSEGDDLDLFALLRKFDHKGREVHFFGYNGFANDGLAKGWLKASHRALDPLLSRQGRPWHTHREYEPVSPDQVVPVEIEIIASSTAFEAGSTLCLEIGGQELARYPALKHRPNSNRGRHTIHTGGPFDSNLLVPIALSDAVGPAA